MIFIKDELETLIFHLDQLSAETKPLWGKMTAQRMIEHLTDGVLTGMGRKELNCPYEGEKLERSRAFLLSEQPMPVEFKAHFVDDNAPLRNEEFDLAVDEFIEAWLDMEDYSEGSPEAVHVHPVFGPLNQTEWRWMHRKHITHHFMQFGLDITEVVDDSDAESEED